ncbi:MAG: hypothetical protein JNM22_12920 [Saprospiraceae bacterium]|nr:hypothetical protein [Saprospiraceae bacterium]
MKTFASLSLVMLFFVVASCKKDDKSQETTYIGDTEMLDCFNRIGIRTIKNNNQDSLIVIIPDNLPAKFNVAGKHLQFNAEIRSNTLTPDFPDPSIDPGTIYQADVSDVKEVQ